ncbi:MAG: hypothetical protein IJT32_01510, partial [Lachnospiraceae bacterium]|nr:hypothetical protein [Lachnospiraceae bacterium]
EVMNASLAGQQEKLDESFAKQQERLDASFAEQQKRMEESLSVLSGLTNMEFDTEKMEAILSEQHKALTASLGGQEDKLSAGFGDVRRDINDLQNNLSEKVHAESVKVYRNMQDYLKEQDHHDADEALLAKKYKTLKIFGIFNVLLTIINIAICAFFLLLIL